MSEHDLTQYQSDDDRIRSRDLSLTSTKPPAKIDGYSIEQFIGRGAYGEVWSGTEKKTGRRVAIKFYTRRTSDDVEQLAREVEKLVALAADRYAVQLVDVDWQANPPYFVMDHFERGSLDDLLRRESSLPVSQAEDIFCEIAMGLMHMHGKGIFHCDLKPANILLDDDDKPRLADFGQSRLTTEKGPSLGTLFYMAPEQADLNVVPAAKWDVYALGAIFYAMLVGRPPYQDASLTERLESSASVEDRLGHYKSALKSAPLPTQHRKLAGVDRALADIIDRAIDPNPNRRFDSVQSVMFAMRQREIAKARKPLLILGILGPLLLLTVMSIFAWFTYDRTYNNTLEAIKKEADDSNTFAAELAASSASAKIAEYFRAVDDLARDKDFVDDLLAAINNSEIEDFSIQLDDPNINSEKDFEHVRDEFRQLKCLENLQKYMDERIENSDKRFPKCASWFVNDSRGMQLASTFATEPATNTIGRNYSYRTYFTGADRDLKRITEDGSDFVVEPWGRERPIIQQPHLSAVFLSKGTSTWKIAFSMPVRDAKEQIIGIVACTAEMGKFISLDFGRASQYAALIDGRPGDNTGAILEHPFFRKHKIDPKRIPKVENITQIRESRLFDDPIAELPDGHEFDREWISALRPVQVDFIQGEIDDNTVAGEREGVLFVLVAEDSKAVFAPVANLGGQLFWLAIYASMFFVVIALTMWLLVFRMFKESGSRLARSFSGGGDSSLNAGSMV